MKDLIKEALNNVKQEKLKRIIFGEMDKVLTPHYKGQYIFFEQNGNDGFYVIEYDKINQDLYWNYRFWVNFFEIFSIERSDFDLIIKEWFKKATNCEVVTTIDYI